MHWEICGQLITVTKKVYFGVIENWVEWEAEYCVYNKKIVYCDATLTYNRIEEKKQEIMASLQGKIFTLPE